MTHLSVTWSSYLISDFDLVQVVQLYLEHVYIIYCTFLY